MFESHGVLIPPLGRGKAIPNDENQVKSGCRVRNTTAQNIHLVNLPPIASAAVPSCRKAIPASTIDSRAADGARRSSKEITSFSSCGVGIAFISFVTCHYALWFWSVASSPRPAFCAESLLCNTTGTVRNPELDKPGYTGDGQKSGRSE